MNFPYNAPRRTGTDQGGSVRNKIQYFQEGRYAAPGNAAITDFYLPLDIIDPWNVFITPRDATTMAAIHSATAGGFHVNGFATVGSASVAAVTDYDWATGTAYVLGQLINDSANAQYICTQAHTSDSASFASDLARKYWEAASPDYGFLKISLDKSASGSVLQINYKIEGYQ